MARFTTFRFCLAPTAGQQAALARHAGAARFACNECLGAVKRGLADRKADPLVRVPWSGFDLINWFNGWKKTEAAGRVIAVTADGEADVVVTGLLWRTEVCQQVFEEAAIDLGRALDAWSQSRSGQRKGRRAGFPRFKRKGRDVPSFRLRNKISGSGLHPIRVGRDGPRSVTLPGIGAIKVHDDTRRLRRLIAKGRGRIRYATCSYRGGRWWVTLNVEAADLHAAHRHPNHDEGGHDRWVGVDRGLSRFAVAANAGGDEITLGNDTPPRALAGGLSRQRRLAKAVSRKQRGSRNRTRAAARLGRHHARVAATRRHFLHQVANELAKTHHQLVLEDLHVAGMLRNRHLARAISDAGWGLFARMLAYKLAWRGGQILTADRWYPSSKRCSACGAVKDGMSLSDRVFHCAACGHAADRDLNAAVNLAAWAETHARARDPQAGGLVTNARRQDGPGQRPRAGETALDDAGTPGTAA